MCENRGRKRSIIGLLVFCALLGACSPRQQLTEDVKDYQQRLANVLSADVNEAISPPLLELPATRELRAGTSELTIKLNEFYALQDCPVATLIAERNTALGRTQLPSRRYVHEVRLIAGLEDCLTRADDLAMQAQLHAWLKTKQADLQANWVNLLLTSEETRSAFGSNSGFIQGDASDNLAAVSQAMHGLIALTDTPSDDIANVEQQLKQLADSPLPALLWRSQRYLGDGLEQTTLWLAHHTRELSCDVSSDKQQAEYLNNVFRLYFIEKLQPLAASLNQYHFALLEHWQILLAHPDIAPAFKDFLRTQLSHFERYQQQLREHVMFWQQFLKQCGMSPAV